MPSDDWTSHRSARRSSRHKVCTKFRINNDLVDVVIALDVHPWVTIPDTVSPEEQASAVMRCRNILRKKIDATLGKVAGREAKDRSKMTKKDADPTDISKCMNRLLTKTCVCMPNKIKGRRSSATKLPQSNLRPPPPPSSSPPPLFCRSRLKPLWMAIPGCCHSCLPLMQ